MWIENSSALDIIQGHHHDPGPNSMLIQIIDPDMRFPQPKFPFKEIHRFKFLDVNDIDLALVPDVRSHAVTKEQAIKLVKCLRHAFQNRMNVIVHCVAGLCRSGAVVEVGELMGFTPVEKFRDPNTRVERLMMQAAGIPQTGALAKQEERDKLFRKRFDID